eukprot:m.61208 g.61208  ORF g.61208 m.61208 type:complete len:207 (+) comp11381_c1_seq1:974-1594(+)
MPHRIHAHIHHITHISHTLLQFNACFQVAAIKDKLREERDVEIERVISRLEEDTAQAHAELEDSYNKRLFRLKERLTEVESKNAQLEEELKVQRDGSSVEMERYTNGMKDLQSQLNAEKETKDRLAKSMREKYEAIELEQSRTIHQLQKDLLDKQQLHDLQISKLTHQHQQQLMSLKSEVKSTLEKKDKAIKDLQLQAQMAKRGIS